MILSGINPTEVRTEAERAAHALGQLGMDRSGNIYQYCKADSGAVTGAGYVVALKPGEYEVDLITTTVSAPGIAQGAPCAIAMAAVEALGFGWFMRCGRTSVRVAGLAARGTTLNTTTTAGQLDDDATAGAETVEGVSLEATNGGSAGLVAAYVNWPYVGRTL